ncbi:unnamed protein product [Rangifer tarandus platyrhynchus]|uniref:Uncharacterized protein n=2 Tax=Rangifer tarandus platyrhynchus TaxID=3082113 RepID=A0ACB0FDY9_RANTA|nr:unnamed protein product [Rangifer tarandus platyrhynchus]CAI9710256.1 unnamed protein product [Rangifer tarandus platyrhynchus]
MGVGEPGAGCPSRSEARLKRQLHLSPPPEAPPPPPGTRLYAAGAPPGPRPSAGGSPTTPGPEVTTPVKPFGWGLGHQLQRPRFNIGNKTADAREGTSAARGR